MRSPLRPAGVAFTACAVLWLGCERSDSPDRGHSGDAEAPARIDSGIDSGIDGTGFNVLLVSVDTTRADHLGCYGHEVIKTPNIDRFATEGTLFRWCISPVPLTLPAHASMMTGSYPFVHGARDNGIFFLDEANVTLAELFKENGYATHAEVAAAVLNERYGLDQGFDTYVGVKSRTPKLNMHRNLRSLDDEGPDIDMVPAEIEVDRKATDITDRGIALMTERAGNDERFFMFLHYFDPHWPHEAPEPFASRYEHGYYSEIAYFDEQFGRLIAALDDLGLAGSTLVILTADHGEGRGNHGEYTHSTFLYDSTLHVPLIMRCPGLVPAGLEITPQVRLIDIPSTILDFVGFDPTPQMQGTSLLPLLTAADLDDVRLPCYAETLVPQNSLNYSPLRALRTSRWKYILAPRSELYDLDDDPQELFNIVQTETARAADMRQELWDLIADSPPPPGDRGSWRTPDAEEVRKLAALGYVSGIAMDDPALQMGSELDHFEPVGVNPRDRIEVIECWAGGLGAYRVGEYESALKSFKRFVELEPENPFGPSYLGRAYTQLKRYDEAIEAFGRSLELRPDNFIDQRMLGTVLLLERRHDEAIASYRMALSFHAEDLPSRLNLGMILAWQNKHAEALETFNEGIRFAPAQGTLRVQRGTTLLALGRFDDAIVDLEKAIEIDAGLVNAHQHLAETLFRSGRTPAALSGLDDAIEAMPDEAVLLQKRAEIYRASGRTQRAGADFARVAELVPDNAMALQNYGSNLMSEGRYPEAIEWFSKALQLRPEFPLAMVNLAAALEFAGELDKASATYDLLLEVSTRNPVPYVRAANLASRRGDDAGAISLLRRGYAILPDSLILANDLAWRLATVADPELRDGPRALALAEYVNAQRGSESCTELDTLATAYAEVGRFDDAVAAAEEALAIARRTNQQELVSEISQRLELFRRQEPFRIP